MITTYQERKVVPMVKVARQSTPSCGARKWVGAGKRRLSTCEPRICAVSNTFIGTRIGLFTGVCVAGDLGRAEGRRWCRYFVISAQTYGVNKGIKAVLLGTGVL